jgi:hypothetical protein
MNVWCVLEWYGKNVEGLKDSIWYDGSDGTARWAAQQS